jgi:hypothetical protein
MTGGGVVELNSLHTINVRVVFHVQEIALVSNIPGLVGYRYVSSKVL